MPNVFVSYSHKDQVTARRFWEGLEREGFDVWWDVAINPGEILDKVTEKALEESRVVLVLWSKASVESLWVRSEATSAERNGTLLPVMIEPCKRPIQFELMRSLDLSAWTGNPEDPDWLSLVAAVRRHVNRGAPADSVGKDKVALSPMSAAAGPRRRRRAPVLWLLLAAMTVLAIGTVVALMLPSSTAPDPVPTTSTVAVIPLAVLPFVNLSSDPEQEYFCDGLSEEILNQLAQIRGLRVIGRTSSFSFKGQNEDLRVIAGKLGVDKLLEGSIRKDGDNVRITARLVDGIDGGRLFSRTYDRKLSQVFTVQEEVAKDVAQALSVTLDVGEMSRVRGGTNDLEAFDRFQRARDAFLRQGGVEGFRSAEPLLREAVRIDPQFTRAWLQLAWLIQSPRAPSRPAAEADATLREASEQVISLAPESWEAKVVRSYQLVRQRKWVEADALATATFLESPLTAASLEKAAIYGQVCTATGRLSETIDMYGQAILLEPASLVISGDRQGHFTSAGRFEDAEAEYLRTMDLSGDHLTMHFLALLRLLAKEDADLRAVRALMPKIWGEEARWPDPIRELALAMGDRNAARAVVRRAFESRQLTAYTTYRVADALGDADLAVTALDEALNAENPVYPMIWAAPFSDVRAHPRFKAILLELGIADFYRATGKWGDFCRPLGEIDFECHP